MIGRKLPVSLDRRAALLGGLSTIVYPVPRLSFAQESRDLIGMIPELALKGYDEVKPFIEWAGGPVGRGIASAATVFGFFGDREWQGRVNAQLNRIEDAVNEINRKLDEVLALLRDLPRIQEAIAEEQRRKELVKEIEAYNQQAYLAVKSYPNPQAMSRNERDILHREVVTHQVRAILEMIRWAQPTHYLTVAYVFSTLLIGARWSRYDPRQYHTLKREVATFLKNKCSDYFRKQYSASIDVEKKNRKTVDAHHADVYLLELAERRGGMLGRVRMPDVPAKVVWVTMKGNYDRGFSHERFGDEGSEVFSADNSPQKRATLYMSPLLNRSIPGVHDRKDDLINQLEGLIREGKRAADAAPKYYGHAVASAWLAKQVERSPEL